MIAKTFVQPGSTMINPTKMILPRTKPGQAAECTPRPSRLRLAV